MATLREKYKNEVIPAMRKEFGYKNAMMVPRLEKVVVNAGVGRVRDDKQHAEIRHFLGIITGQRPAPRAARKAIASFKTRQGLVIGYQVTLRGKRMFDFISRLINIALPRTRDFRGIDRASFDDRGNLTIGVKEHIVFPEMIGEDYHFMFGFEVTVVTTGKNKAESIELLKLMGFPIRSD